MILSREEILELVNSRNIIQNFDQDCLQAAGYDLRIGKVYGLKKGGFLGARKQENPEVEELLREEYVLPPGEYVLIETIESVKIPENLAGRILPRSSVFRCGVAMMNALVDPGYRGRLTLGLKNLSEVEFRFEKGTRIGQLILEEVKGGVKPYQGRYQGGRVV